MGLANSVRRLRFTLIAGLLLLALPLQSQDFAWARGMGGMVVDLATCVTTDDAGNVYITGHFRRTVDFDPGVGVANLTAADSSDVFVLKLDSAGSFMWVRGMGGTYEDEAQSVFVDAVGNVYTTGYFYGVADFDPGVGVANLTSAGGYNAFISKLDRDGNFVWAKVLSTPGLSEGWSVEVDGAGNVFTSGYFSSVADFDPGVGVVNLAATGGENAFISKLDSGGNFVWSRVVGGRGYTWAGEMALDFAGNIYLTGLCAGTTDFDPGSGVANLSCSGSADVFVLKLDRAGSFVWARRMGGPYYATGVGVTVDAAGNVYTTGYFEGTADFDPGADVANLTSAGDHGAFISKLDPDGNFVWAKVLSGSGYSAGWGVAVDAAGNVYTAGVFLGPVDFDPGPSAAILHHRSF